MKRLHAHQQGPQVLDTPKLIQSITTDRCSNFISGGANGNDINLLSQLYKARTNSEEFISLLVYSVPDLQRIPFEQAVRQTFRPTRLGEWFGPSWVQLPSEFTGEEVHFVWDADNEALIWSTQGVPLQGLTGGAGVEARHEFILTAAAEEGGVFQFYIEMACNTMFGAGTDLIGPPDPSRFFSLNQLDLAVPNKLAWQLLYDFQVILGMAKDMPSESLRATQALYTANTIINAFRPGDNASLEKCLSIAAEFLSAKNGDAQHQIFAVGHCHIDTAWLWPFDETIRKAARSWSSQIDLMDRYAEYKFACSQAQQYEWVRDRYPSLWDRILKKVTEGQFVPTGGTWVEMDTNMPSGESLCRQFLLGQRFFEKHVGQRCTVFWLPDSFGYSPQLPQLMQLAGLQYFFTQKLSWNNVNKFPLTTFWWIGLDGSKALTHMTPSETYSAQCTPEELLRSVKNHKDKAYSNASLLVYGNGDGGGGPLASMLERLQRMKNDGLARTKMSSPTEFYESVERDASTLTTWRGEMYFELHRGIYTTHGLCKRLNRSTEFLLRDVELLATLAYIINPKRDPYPHEDLETHWKMLCLTQFHDVMTGSSIEIVYSDALKMYSKIETWGQQTRQQLLQSLLDFEETTATDVNGIAVFNTLAWQRQEVVEIPLVPGLPTMAQYSSFNHTGYMLLEDVPSLGVKGYAIESPSVPLEPVKVSADDNHGAVLENAYLLARFDATGELVEMYDKKQRRSLIKPGERGNVFKMYDDVPLFWDAWDVEIYHLEKGRTVEGGSLQIVEQGPLRGALLIQKQISDTSQLRQVVVLTAVSRRLDFENKVSWNENRQFLKVEFAWDIMADTAYYETQYGVIQRPTHYNTSWDSAKFEVVAHKFADLSEYGYGVALLNDCKYGYATHNNVVRLSLIRSPKAPNSNCDIGHHAFNYAVYPHEGHFLQSDVVRQGFNFNVPLLTKSIPSDKVQGLCEHIPCFSIQDAPNVVLDTVKKAEDSKDIILRLYEAYGGHAKARLQSTIPMTMMTKCNILEEDLETFIPVPCNDEDLYSMTVQMIGDESVFEHTLDLKPFEVLTLKITLLAIP